jgi:hypothetical protein
MEMIGREVSGSMATIRNLRARSVEGAFAVLGEIKLALWRFRTAATGRSPADLPPRLGQPDREIQGSQQTPGPPAKRTPPAKGAFHLWV